MTQELFFEPETSPEGLKSSANMTWNEIEYMLDNPYITGGGGHAAVIGARCADANGPVPLNEQGFPAYCTPVTGDGAAAFSVVRRPTFGEMYPTRANVNGGVTMHIGLPPLRVHPLNYSSPNGNEQRVLNPNFAGTNNFNNTGTCYTTGASCTPTNSVIPVSAGSTRLDPNETPEIDWNIAIGSEANFCQTNPEPVPLGGPNGAGGTFGGPFNTAFDSEALTACGTDPGEPGAAMSFITSDGTRNGTVLLRLEDNLGLPYAGQGTTSWYSTPAVPAGNAAIALLRQIPSGMIPGVPTGTSFPIQSSEWLVDPGARGRIVPYDPINGTGGLKKPTLRSAAAGYPVSGAGLNPNYLFNSTGAVSAARPDPTGANLQPSNENDYYSLYNPASPNAAYSAGVTAGNFYQRKANARMEAARLGKALFWDMQVGSDGVQSCGSCHAHAGADNRTKNQINPNGQDGIRGNPTNFVLGPNLLFDHLQPNQDMTVANFPFHKLANPEIAGDPACKAPIIGNTTGFVFPDADPQQNPFPVQGGGSYTACDAANIQDDTEQVASSMGVHFGYFYDIPAGTGTGLANPPGATSPFGRASIPSGVRALIRDQRAPLAAGCTAGTACDLNVDPIPGFAGTGGPNGFNEYRRVEPRNTPTIFLAQFNFDNFWDGRARHDDNGGSVFGLSDPQSHVFVDQVGRGQLTATRQLIKFTSIASLAKGPGLSKFEMSYLNRNWAKVAKKLLQKGVTPLANQLVDPTDSILGPYSNQNGSACGSLQVADRSPEGGPATTLGVGVPGLCITYSALIRHGFYPALWQNQGSHLNGCYTDAFVADGQPLNPAIVAVHPNQCGTAGYPAASIMVLNPDGTVSSHNNDPFDTYVLNIAPGAATATDTNQFRQIEGNFGLFWGQSINAWAGLLVPDMTPFDQFMDLNPDAAMTMGESGEPLLVLDMPTCNAYPANYTPDNKHPRCFTEVGNFKRDVYNAGDIVGTPAFPVQNDTNGHPRMSACVSQLVFNGDTGTRICTRYVPAGGTRGPNDPDPLLGMDLFFGSNASLKNPEFRSARCGACHNAPNLTDNTTSFTHGEALPDAFAEFEKGNPQNEPNEEPLPLLRLISGFHLESEVNDPAGQGGIERQVPNLSIVPAPIAGAATSAGSFTTNGNCITDNCSGYSWPDAITYDGTTNTYTVHHDLGTGPVAGAGDPVPFTGFGGAFFDNGVYNIGVRPCVADYQGNITGACEDTGRGNTDAFGWPLSLAALLLKDAGGPAQQTGMPLPNFDPTNANLGGRADGQPCAPWCATGGLFNLNPADQRINPGYNEELTHPLLPPHMYPFVNSLSVGDSHPQLDEVCAPQGSGGGGCFNTLSDIANGEGFPEFPVDSRPYLTEVLNNTAAYADATVGGPGFAEMGTWPVVNRVSRMGNFKAPQLREVELTGPYFHNGGKLTLRQVVDFYVRGGDFPVTNASNRDFNLLNLNAEIQSNLNENEKVSIVDFLLELTDNRVALEAAPFDHPQEILPLDGTAPESDGTINRDAMLTGCVAAPAQFGPGQQFCAGNTAAVTAATGATGPLFLNVPATGAAGNPGGRIPNFLGIAGAAPDAAQPAGRQRLVGAAANCGANITSQYCH